MKIAAASSFLAVLLAGAAAQAESIPACACAPAADHAVKELGRHPSAFAGKVTEVTGETVTFEVARVWKGPRQKALTLTTTSKPGCTFAFEVGKDYVVFADGRKDALSTDVCSPNRELADSGRAVRQLDLHAGYASSPLRVPSK